MQILGWCCALISGAILIIVHVQYYRAGIAQRRLDDEVIQRSQRQSLFWEEFLK